MKILNSENLIRNIEADDYFELFLTTAVSTIILIRFYLYITGYPQIGGGGLHIAHMLWGGLLMTIAIILQFAFLQKSAYYVAATLGGIGFGLFIDELGKFITRDNNYFFQPTIALIYIIFIIIYLTFKTSFRRSAFSEKEYLINSLEMLEEAILLDLDKDEKQKALKYLKASNDKNIITKELLKLFPKLDAISKPKENWLSKTHALLRNYYQKLQKSKNFQLLVIGLLILHPVLTLTLVFSLANSLLDILFDPNTSPRLIMEWGFLISSGISIIFLALAILILPQNRLLSFRTAKRGVIISIFFTQFFAFYSIQFLALILLIYNLILRFGVNYVLEQELLENPTTLG